MVNLPTKFYYSDLSQARRGIKIAGIFGLISGGLTLAVTLAAMNNPEVAVKTGFNVGNLLDVVLVLGLAWGVFCKNRACAVTLQGYFLVGKVVQIAAGVASPAAIGLGFIFAWGYFNGVRGTFTYHKLRQVAD